MSPVPAMRLLWNYLCRNTNLHQFVVYIFKFFPVLINNMGFNTSFRKFYLQVGLCCDVYTSKSPRLLRYIAKPFHPQIIQTRELHQKLITMIINQSEGFMLSFCI